MKPLREVETLPYGDFSRSSEKCLAPPPHWTIPTQEAAVAYMDYLDALNLSERELVVTELLYTRIEAGSVAQRRGYPDVVETRIGICGSSEPWVVCRSETMDEELDNLANLWRALATVRGVADGAKIYRWLDDYGAIQLGFQRLVAEIIYGDYGNDWLTEYATPHIEALIMDSARLRELTTEWYKDNHPEPKKVRMPFLRGLLQREQADKEK